MKIRTLNELIDFLSAEIAWRKFELSVLNGQIIRHQNNPNISNTLIRSGVAILYAHWEGFIKASSIAYLEYISNQNLCYRDLTIPYRVLGIRKNLNMVYLSNANKSEGLIDMVNIILNKQEDKCRFEPENSIDTKSNLDSKTFKEIIHILGFEYDRYETKEKLIDGSLLYYRNNIAHGKEMYPEYDLFKNLYKDILLLIEQFKTDLENAAIIKNFLVPKQ